eukprot:scaffold78_cov609-Prasinococcus_capsulatus_cf.AAC.3
MGRCYWQAVRAASLVEKPYLALGAWGKRGGVTAHTAEARHLGAFLDGLDKDGPIQHRMIDALEYYGELSKYKFLIAPRGNGIQSPKMMEALLVRQKGCAHACPELAPGGALLGFGLLSVSSVGIAGSYYPRDQALCMF